MQSKLRLVDTAWKSSEIPLSVYLQPTPTVLHPDPEVLTAHWHYRELDPNREIRCQRGGMVAFTVGFDMTLALNSLRIVFADSLRGGGKVIQFPDVELSLTGGKNLTSTNCTSILEILLRIAAGFAH
jgi:hypothetical protein